MEFFIYLAIMALSTYAIRAIPLVLANRKITNRFLRSFLHYIPYAVLTAITVPAGLFATGNIVSAAAGLFCAILVSGKNGQSVYQRRYCLRRGVDHRHNHVPGVICLVAFALFLCYNEKNSS